MRLPLPPVLVITDRRQAKLPLDELAEALFAGGCRWLSLREKDLPPEERHALLRRLVVLGQKSGATVTVHDDLAAAAALGIGLHLPADGSVAEARRALGAAAIIGISAHSPEDVAEAAAAAGADYATLSPVFVSPSKPGYGPALGLPALRCTASFSILALGGIDATNAAACIDAGAAGVAVMGEAMRAADPQRFMADLLARLAPALARLDTAAHSSGESRNGRAAP